MTTPTPAARRPAEPARQIRAYFKSLPPHTRKVLTIMRATIRAAAPGATEAFSYRIPAFRLEGRPLVWYAAFTNHVSLYPMTAVTRRAHAAALKSYGTSTGTVRFALDAPLPVTLVRRLVKTRISEVRAKAKRS